MREFREGRQTEVNEEQPVEKPLTKPGPFEGNPFSADADERKRSKGDQFESAFTLKANQTYETSNKAIYHTNENGRIEHFSGELSLDPEKRHLADQRNLEGKYETDHAGHLIAREMGGSGYVDNMVPMDGKVNTRDYRAFERENRAILENGYDVHLDGDVYYSSENDRPDAFMVTRTITDKDGKVLEKEHFSWSNIDMSQFDDMEEDWYDDDIPNPMHDPDYPQLTQEEYDEIDNADYKSPYALKHKSGSQNPNQL